MINDKEASEQAQNRKLVGLQSDYEECKGALDSIKSAKKPDIRNITKEVKRRNLTIERKNQKLHEKAVQLEKKDATLKAAKDYLDDSLSSVRVAEAQIDMLKRKKKLLQQRMSYYAHKEKRNNKIHC